MTLWPLIKHQRSWPAGIVYGMQAGLAWAASPATAPACIPDSGLTFEPCRLSRPRFQDLPAESDDPGVQALINYYKNQRCPPDADGGMYVPGYGYFPKAGGDIIDSVLARQAEATAAAADVRPHRPAAADVQQQHVADDDDLPPTMMMVPIGYCAGTYAAGLASQLPAAQQVQLLPLPPGEEAVSRCHVYTLRRHACATLRRTGAHVCQWHAACLR